MRNAGLEEAQAGIKIAGRDNSNLKYADDTTLMAENEEELKSLLMKVKEEGEKAGLKMVMITLYAREQKRHRCIEQTFGFCGRGRGWNDSGEWH